jgi:hypothetical protein
MYKNLFVCYCEIEGGFKSHEYQNKFRAANSKDSFISFHKFLDFYENCWFVQQKILRQ